MDEIQEAVKSTHKVEVVRVRPELHPNADKLMVVPVWGYTCCISIHDWRDVPRDEDGYILAAYVPPDSIVDVRRPEFEFLRTKAVFNGDGSVKEYVVDQTITEFRTKAKRLRGIVSYGFLLPAPAGSQVGEDLAEKLGVTHYEPAMEQVKNLATGGEACSGPTVFHVKYDVDSMRRFNQAFKHGEPVVVTEKLDGCLREDTLVTMSDSSEKTICKVKCGDAIKSFNQTLGAFEDVEVEAVIVRKASNNWLRLDFDNSRLLFCTTNHPVLTSNGWVEAGKLTKQHEIVSY